jgi:hypothetical protein
MTHKRDYTFASGLTENGFEVIPELRRVLFNNPMQSSRAIASKRLSTQQNPLVTPVSTKPRSFE